MTKKRFEGEEDSDYIRDNKTDERELYLCDWLDKLNNLSDENEQLKSELRKQSKQCTESIARIKEENNQLKKELFESEEEYLLETYSDNPIRRDGKIQDLRKEFKERFGDDFE